MFVCSFAEYYYVRTLKRSHQFAHRYPSSCRKAPAGWISSGQSRRMRYELLTDEINIGFDVHFNFHFPLLVIQGIYSHPVDVVDRRGNNKTDLHSMKAQKDSFGWYNTHRANRTPN